MKLNQIPHSNFSRNNIQLDARYDYQILTKAHVDDVVDVFTNAFCDSEPMTHYLQMDKTKYRIFAKAVTDKAVEDQMSVIALHNNKVIACALVEDLVDPSPIPDFDPKFAAILALLEQLGASYFPGKSFAPKEVSHLFITAVDCDYRHQGLSTQVNFHAMDVAEALGFKLVYCELTHPYNEKGILHHLKNKKQRIGHQVYREFVYENKKPFANLEGEANSYLWEINPNKQSEKNLLLAETALDN